MDFNQQLRNELYEIVKNKDKKIAENFITNHFYLINTINKESTIDDLNNIYYTFLLYALENNASTSFINAIISSYNHKKDRNRQSEEQSLFYFSFLKNNFVVADLLLKKEAYLSINFEDLLFNLIKENLISKGKIKYLLNKGFSPVLEKLYQFNQSLSLFLKKNKNGLYITVRDIIDILMDLINYYTFNNEVILNYLFIYKKRSSMSNEQLEANVLSNKIKIEIPETTLGLLIQKNDMKDIKFLFHYCSNNLGDLLKLAAENEGSQEIIKYIIELGADINCTNYYGDTPLLIACYHDNIELVKYLIENGADINVKSKESNTALWYFFNNQNNDMVKYLIQKGADINTKNREEDTLLICACRQYNVQMIKYLIENGAAINTKK
jgi:hypothetical protein